MEGGEVEYWRIDEQSGLEEEEEDGKGIVSKTTRWALKAGLRLGKKVVITGIAVSSAPLVLPPLITICVVGFIVLVPVGVVLGSYACTEKLMSKLLPIPLLEYDSQALRDGNHQVEEEFGEELYGRVYEGEFALIQEEMKMEGEQRIELVRDNEEEESEYGEILDVNIDENLEDEEGYGEGEHQEKNEISIDEDLEEGYEEDIEVNLETDDEPGRKEEELNYSEFGGLDLEATSAGTTENHKLGTDEADENFEHISLTLLGNVGSSSMNEDVEHLEKTREFEEEEDKVDNENPVFIGTEAKVEITTVAVVKETQLAPETENKQGNGENSNASEQVSAPEHNKINSNEGAGAPSSEKIWEQISAIRGILGYTAAPQSSTVDELKALFILTGVEPPSPFEDPSDLADVDEKLRLLMSIVGAK
nr:ABC transporter F family member 4-like isoform X1 [Ipomoea batatas]